MAEKLLSISILVSGREDTTEKCIDSLNPLREALDSELILVDTGCGGELRKKLEQRADRIIDFAWCDDFAKARNAGLEAAKGEWFLFLDDDEWFEDITPILSFFTSGEYRDYQQAVYKARNYSKPDGSAYTDEWVSRMIRLEADTRFEGKVHEALLPARGKCKKLDAFVHHYGYAFPDKAAQRAHRERNTKILAQLIADEPDNMKWRLQIIQEYAQPETAVELRDEGRKAVTLVKEADKPFVNQCRGAFYSAVLLADLWLSDAGAWKADCEEFLADKRNTPETVCSLNKYKLDGLKRQAGQTAADDERELYRIYEEIVCCSEQFLDAYERSKSEEADEQEQIIRESILFVKDVMTEGVYRDVKLAWAAALARTGKTAEIPQDYLDKVTEQLRIYLNGNGEFLFMQEELWELGIAEAVPLEELLLDLELSQWMAQVLVLRSKKSEELWDKYRILLFRLQTREHILYDYFHAQAVNDAIVKCREDLSYEAMCEYLQEFAECNLRFAGWVYKEAAFSGEMEMLDERCRAAVWIAEMTECDTQDWNGRLEYLKKSAKAWPALGETIKQAAALIGKEQERMQKEAEQAATELQVIAKQVKGQIKTLLDAGMKEEAKKALLQLRQIIPDDAELKELERRL